MISVDSFIQSYECAGLDTALFQVSSIEAGVGDGLRRRHTTLSLPTAVRVG